MSDRVARRAAQPAETVVVRRALASDAAALATLVGVLGYPAEERRLPSTGVAACVPAAIPIA